MPKPKNYRWICPQCGKGKNAPSRLRKDDPRRYCLDCSGKPGVLTLVERYAPTLEKKRAKKRAKSQAKAAKKAKAKRERERPRKEAKRRAKRERRKRKRDQQEWRERYTRDVQPSDIDETLYKRVGNGDPYREMHITVLRVVGQVGQVLRYVPKWASALKDQIGRAIPYTKGVDHSQAVNHWAHELGRFVTKQKGIEDALIAVWAAEPRRVLPYVVGQYNLPGLPESLRQTAAEIEADLAGEPSPLLTRFNRRVVRKMVSP